MVCLGLWGPGDTGLSMINLSVGELGQVDHTLTIKFGDRAGIRANS